MNKKFLSFCVCLYVQQTQKHTRCPATNLSAKKCQKRSRKQKDNFIVTSDKWRINRVKEEVYSTRVGETGRPLDDGGGGELTGPRRGDPAAVPETVRIRICRCSGVSGMQCRVTSQWLCSMDVCRQNISASRRLELCRFGADVTASGCRIRSLRPR